MGSIDNDAGYHTGGSGEKVFISPLDPGHVKQVLGDAAAVYKELHRKASERVTQIRNAAAALKDMDPATAELLSMHAARMASVASAYTSTRACLETDAARWSAEVGR